MTAKSRSTSRLRAIVRRRSPIAFPAAVFSASLVAFASGAAQAGPEVLPNSQTITPTAAHGSTFAPLNPHLSDNPNYLVGQAVASVVSPDEKTLLVLTSGYNRVVDASGNNMASQSNEYVFVFDITLGSSPVQRQAIPVPDTFVGLVFAPDGNTFYVSGGQDDNVHIYTRGTSGWAENGSPIALGHGPGNGLVPSSTGPIAGGIAVTADGTKLVVANFEHDSISVVDVASRTKMADLDLRPGKLDAKQAGIAGGEFPYGVAIKGNGIAYVSSIRDREIVVVDIGATPQVVGRVPVQGNPNKLLLNKAQTRLFVATDNADTVDVIDTGSNAVVHRIKTTAPRGLIAGRLPTGSSPNSLALSPHEETLYVTNSGTNSVAVIELDDEGRGEVSGLIPTGWFPSSVSVSADGRTLYVVNGKSNAGANPGQCTGTSATSTFAPGCPPSLQNGSSNGYVWQLTKAGFLTLPVPHARELARLTEIVARNDGLTHSATAAEADMLEALQDRIKHVVYVVKENRTYDQVLGDLPGGNGDPTIAQFPQPITPNLHALASQFVNLDNFYDSGEVSQDGWQWSTAARSADINDKGAAVNYGSRGTTYDSEGTDRNINVAFATSAERKLHDPLNPTDPDLLPGPRNESELDGPDGEEGAGYIWDAALRGHKSYRNYGFWIDLTLYFTPASFGGIPPIRDAFSAGVKVATATSPTLLPVTDPYFRGFDTALPDFYRFKEWEREFDAYAASGALPQFETVRFMEDHMGSFGTAIDGVNTPETQQADNDYAVGLLVDKIAHSRFASDTLVFVLEDDAQDGPDHVDAHRSTAYVVGPYVKHRAVVSTHYSTVNMVRTIEDILGVGHLNVHDGGAHPLADVFDLHQQVWTFTAAPSDILRTSTTLPLPRKPAGVAIAPLKSTHDAAWWAANTLGFDFRKEDQIDAQAFNRILWKGLMANRPYPTGRAAKKD